jgi:hypothetical protein
VGDYTVVGDVSTILKDMLTAALADLRPGNIKAELNDLSNTIQVTEPVLTVFLYEIAEDPASRNRPPIRAGGPASLVIRKPPMALLLRYLITAWGGDQVTQHRMLGRALETFYDNAIIDGPRLSGSLAGTTDALQLTLTPLTLEQKSYVWYAIQKPYRLSLNYEVRVVNLDSAVTSAAAPVTSRVIAPAGPGHTVGIAR